MIIIRWFKWRMMFSRLNDHDTLSSPESECEWIGRLEESAGCQRSTVLLLFDFSMLGSQLFELNCLWPELGCPGSTDLLEPGPRGDTCHGGLKMPGVWQIIVNILRQSEPSSSLAVLERVWRTENREESPWLCKLLGPDNLRPPEDEINRGI